MSDDRAQFRALAKVTRAAADPIRAAHELEQAQRALGGARGVLQAILRRGGHGRATPLRLPRAETMEAPEGEQLYVTVDEATDEVVLWVGPEEDADA